MKRTIWIAGALIIIVVIAIGGYAAFNLPASSPAPSEKFKVAVTLFGAALDGSWNQFWYEGANQVALLNPDIEITSAEWVYTADYERVASGYASQGYDLMIATAGDYQDGALKIAPNFPNTYQVVQTGWLNASNVAPLNIWPNEGSYLAGMLAAYMTNTSKLGIVGSNPWPSQIAAFDGFERGAKAVDPNIDVEEVWTNSYTDTAVGRSAAIALLDADVDVIYFTISGMALGGIPAVVERNKLAIGAFLDMNSLGPQNVITSVLWNAPGPIMAVIDSIRDGTFDGHSYDFFMKDGACDIAPYHYLDSMIPADVKAKIADTRAAILSGTLQIPLVTSR
jgi:basic membrane protein A